MHKKNKKVKSVEKGNKIKTAIKTIREYSQGNAIILDGFDGALVGMGAKAKDDFLVAVYDLEKMVDIVMKRDGVDHKIALEFIEFSFINTYKEEGSPIFMTKLV